LAGSAFAISLNALPVGRRSNNLGTPKQSAWKVALLRFSLHPGIDASALALAYASEGLASISPFIPDEQADALHEHLLDRDDWQLRLQNVGGKLFELSPEQIAEWGAEKIDAMRTLAAPRQGQKGVGYTHDCLRIIKTRGDRLESATPLGKFGEFLNSGPVLDLIKAITGGDEINFADLFAARYDPGDYATMHDDGLEDRKVAYVYGLTKSWRADWGGLLLFHRGDRQIDAGLVPGFNVFDLFKVPVEHSVSIVAPFASEPRLSLTGWFRDLNESEADA
jgi:hypothetical protein